MNFRKQILAIAFLIGLFSPIQKSGAVEKGLAGHQVVRLQAFPEKIQLNSPFAYRQLVLSAHLENGDVLDVTHQAKIQLPKGVQLSSSRIVSPDWSNKQNTKGELDIAFGGKSIKIPIEVTNGDKEPPVSFVRDVMPVLGKLGCNAGTCHGAAEGKNGFKLSLRGYDPLFDHRSLTDDLEGRRFNRSAPEQSLMLLKPAGGVPHAGGILWQPGDPNYELLKAWIAAGAKSELQTTRVQRIEMYPQSPTIPQIGMKQQFAVIAYYPDGISRDVTREAFIESSNSETATVDKTGLATTIRRGEATMLARYEGAYTASTMVVMGDRSGFKWKETEAYNQIDQLVYQKLKRIRVLPSDLCTDAEFIRRVYLDLTGLPASSDDVRKFLTDKRPTRQKRDELIDKLIGSEPFIEHWTNKWSDLLQVNRKFLGDPGAKSLRDYIRKAISENMPYDRFAYSILTGTGSNVENPTASYFKILRTPDALMENTTHLFLAIRFNCNKCHDHPFERWTQTQYFELSGYFAQVSRSEDPKFKGQRIGGTAVEGAVPLVEVIKDINSGDVKNERTGDIAKPHFPFEFPLQFDSKETRRVQLAKWITSPNNPYFARSYVNRIWSYLTGVGIIEPIDDIRAGNPPTNPELLDYLTKEFIDSHFNVRRLMQLICKSRTYQLSIQTNRWNEGDDMNYAHAVARRLSAESLFDAIHEVTGTPFDIPGLPPNARAAQVLDGTVPLPGGFLELFGKPLRESACECERSNNLMLGPVLNLVNGPVVGEAIRRRGNRLEDLASKFADNRKLIEELYLDILNRYPTEAEIKIGLQAIQDGLDDYAQQQKEYQQKVANLKAYEKQVDSKQIDWENKLKRESVWQVLQLKGERQGKKGPNFSPQPDGSVFVIGPNRTPETYSLTTTTKLRRVTAIRLETLADDRLPGRGPGRAPNGNFVLNDFSVFSRPMGLKIPILKKQFLMNPKADFSQNSFDIAGAIDNNPETAWAIVPQTGTNHVAMFTFKQPLENANTQIFSIRMLQKFTGKLHTIGRFRISVTDDPMPVYGPAAPTEAIVLAKIPPEKRTETQKQRLFQLHREEDPEYRRLLNLTASPPPSDKRVTGLQDLTWALINSPAFLFNH